GPPEVWSGVRPSAPHAAGHGGERGVRATPGAGALLVTVVEGPSRRGVTASVLHAASVTESAAGVGERHAGDRDELPVVGTVAQRELEDPVVPAAHFAVGDGGPQRVGARAPGPDHEFPNAALPARGTVGRLRREALVVVLVPGEDDVGTVIVQRLPQRLRYGRAQMRGAGTESRDVPVGEGALRRVRREVGAEPLLLGRACAHVDLGVQRYDVPAAEIVAVVALAGVAGGDAEVTEIARRPGLLIVVVARHRVRALAVAAPAGREAILVVRIGAVRVGVVAQQE